MNWILFIFVIVFVYLTVKNSWFYDPTSPEKPKRTKAENWFLFKKKR